MKAEVINLSSFNVKSQLNPSVWVDFYMRDKIRNKLNLIANDFIDSIDIKGLKIKDITLTGSLANFNWSKYSDFDLHIIVDFSKVNDDVELVKEYFNTQKNLWNETHGIFIYCFEVEVYVQDENEPHSSSGVFSVKNDEWIVKPEKQNPVLDTKLITNKTMGFIDEIKRVLSDLSTGAYDDVIKKYNSLNKRLKKMRANGLDREGEYSYENIVYKALRRSNYIPKLRDAAVKAYDYKQSIGDNCYT